MTRFTPAPDTFLLLVAYYLFCRCGSRPSTRS